MELTWRSVLRFIPIKETTKICVSFNVSVRFKNKAFCNTKLNIIRQVIIYDRIVLII